MPHPVEPVRAHGVRGHRPAAADAEPADESMEAQEQDTALLLTLPQGLDWRTQPFSHVGGPGSRPRRVPEQGRRLLSGADAHQ